MAGDGELGNLIIKISTDVEDIKKGLDKAKKETDAFSKTVSTSFKAVAGALAAALSVQKVVEFGRSVVELGDQLNALSKSTGLAASEIAALRFAASQSDTSIEAVSQNIRVLAKNMDAAANGNEAAREVFRRFHIEYQNGDGTLRNYRDVLGEVADRISNTKDKATALAAAQQLLGRNAQETFAFFDQGSAAIKRLEDRYFQLGASREEVDALAKQADELKDSWDEVSKKFEIVGIKIMAGVMPAIKELADWLIETDWTPFTKFLQEVVSLLVGAAEAAGQLAQGAASLFSSKDKSQNGGILAGEDVGKIAANRKQIIDTVYGGKDPGAGTVTQMPDGGQLGPAQQGQGGAGAGAGGGQGIDSGTKFNPFGGNFLEEMKTNLQAAQKEFDTVAKQMAKIWEDLVDGMSQKFGQSIAEVIVDGKDFGEAMQELWKDLAKQVISQIVSMIAKLILLYTWQVLTGTVGTGKGAGKFLGFDKGGVIGARNGLFAGQDGLTRTGPMGEGGIPAVVHPGEIISPIDKFFDAVKTAGPKNFYIQADGARDPQMLAQLLAVEIDRQSRGV